MAEFEYIVNNLVPKEEKRIKIKRGAKVVLAMNSEGSYVPHKYVFNKDYFTESQAEETMLKLGVEASKPEIGGKVWSSGMHHVFVDGKPARVYVPEETINHTFNEMQSYIERNGSLKIGLDHLQEEFLNDNQILAKMNLLDVGEITGIHTDGNGIYIDESKLTNEQIRDLNSRGELPMYSIVGSMETRPCPTGKADYIVEHLDVERVDIVEEGGCAACKVDLGVSEDLKITAKLSKVEAKDMAEETELNNMDKIKQLEEQLKALKETIEEPEEKVEEEVPVEEEQEEVEEPVVEEPEVVSEPEEVKEEEPADEIKDEAPEKDPRDERIVELEKKLEELEGKKAPIAAKESTFDIDKAIDDLVSEGRASPKMRAALMEVGAVSEDAFKKIAASLPKDYRTKVMAKFAKVDVDKEEKEKEEEERKRYLKAMGL